MTEDDPLFPDEAFDTAQAVLEEWLARAENEVGDGTAVGPHTALINAAARQAALLSAKLARHRPVYQDGEWACPTCVEMQIFGLTRATAPCREALEILSTVLGPYRIADAVPAGMQLIVQDGAEPYMGMIISALEREHGLSEQHAHTYASTIVRALSGLRQRLRR